MWRERKRKAEYVRDGPQSGTFWDAPQNETSDRIDKDKDID